MEKDLEGKVALVTGGTRGIGRAIALDLARRGADVAVVFFRNRTTAEETRRVIEDQGVKALSMPAHVGDPAKFNTVFDKVAETFGRLDVFVSNAAQGVFRPLDDLGLKEWTWTIDANARAFFLGAKRAKELMDEGGTVVAISTFGSMRVLHDYSIVGASKAAMEALVRYMAVEWGEAGIRVNAVAPTAVDTDVLSIYTGTEQTKAWQEHAPVKGLVSAQDVSDAVMFLTSNRSRMITGQTLIIDGGAGLITSQWWNPS